MVRKLIFLFLVLVAGILLILFGLFANTCPSHRPLLDIDGKCYACDEPRYTLPVGCDACPNRALIRGGDVCGFACPPDKPLMDGYGKCHACVDTGVINVDNIEENCKVCPNRILNGRYCVAPCPLDKVLFGMNGKCYACDDKSRVFVNGDSKYCNVCPNRTMEGDFCVLK